MPLVSVVLSSYNHEKYIRESIESVLNQTFKDFELIISDDCSTDDSWKIIREYKDSRIKAIRHITNEYYHLTPELISTLRGKYVAVHHSDDVWEPTKLEKQVAFMEEHPEYAACFTLVNFIDENSKIYTLSNSNPYAGVFDKENRSKEEWLHYFFYYGNCLCHPSVLIRKCTYAKHDLTSCYGLYQLPDFYMWIKLCFHENIFVLQEKLTKFRISRIEQTNVSTSNLLSVTRNSDETYIIFKKFHEFIKSSDMLIKIFPETNKYVTAFREGFKCTANNNILDYLREKINYCKQLLYRDKYVPIDFVYAQLCLETHRRELAIIALEILFSLLNDKYTSDLINKFYGYNYHSFFDVTTRMDIFGVRGQLLILESTLYLDTGSGYNETETIKRDVFVKSNGDFFAKFTINTKKPIRSVRFDPDENRFCILQIYNIYAGELRLYAQPINATITKDNYDYFFTSDPQYQIISENTNLKIGMTVTIQGNIMPNSNQVISQEITKIFEEHSK